MDKTIELKATAETITFTKTPNETNGLITEVIVTLNANGEGPPAHRHVFQT